MTTRTELLPISEWQKLMVRAQNDPTASPEFFKKIIVKWAHLVTPGIDERRLRRVFDTLVKRHDSLRLEFVQSVDGDWMAAIRPKHLTGLLAQDFGDVSDEEFNRIFNDFADSPINLLDEPMFQMHLLKFGTRGDVILMRAHHAIIDGYGAILLAEEMFQSFLGVPLTGNAISHAEFMRFHANELKKNQSAKDEYWASELLPLPEGPDIGRKAHGKPMAEIYQVHKGYALEGKASAPDLEQIEKTAIKNGHSLFAHILTAFADVLCDMAGSDDLHITTNVGRSDPLLSGFVGSTVAMMLVRYQRKPGDSIEDKVARTADKIIQGITHLPWEGHLGSGFVARAFAEKDRSVRQLRVHIPFSEGRKRRSVFSDTLSAGKSGTISFGHFSLTQLQFPKSLASLVELQLDLQETPDGHSLSMVCDAESFSEQELQEIERKIGLKLGLT